MSISLIWPVLFLWPKGGYGIAQKVTTVLSLRDNYTAVIKKARRYTSRPFQHAHGGAADRAFYEHERQKIERIMKGQK